METAGGQVGHRQVHCREFIVSFCCCRQVVGDGGEDRDERTTNRVDDCEDRDTDAGSNQTVFDCGHAAFVGSKAFQKAHGVSPGMLRFRSARTRPSRPDLRAVMQSCRRFVQINLDCKNIQKRACTAQIVIRRQITLRAKESRGLANRFQPLSVRE
jgi:hypothetical protein